MALRHTTIPAGVDQPGFTGVTPTLYGEEHSFSGGTHASLLIRNTTETYGSSWVASTTGVLISAGANEIPSYSQTLPTATQDLITRLGTVVSGVWNATVIGAAYGGTGLNTSASTGVAQVAAGTWSVAAVSVANGGTGLASYSVGDLLYASGATTLSKLADVATGQVLVSGGVGVAPAWSGTPSVTDLTTTGVHKLANGLVGTPGLTFTANLDTGLYLTSGLMAASQDGTLAWYLSSGAGLVARQLVLDVSSADVILVRDAANTLALRNSTTAQAFRAYNTYTDSSNYERAGFRWTSNVLRITTEKLGTGTIRDLWIGPTDAAKLVLSTNDVSRWEVLSTGHLVAQTDNAYDIGAAGATRPRNVYVAGTGAFGGTLAWGGGSALTSSSIVVLTNASNTVTGSIRFTGAAPGHAASSTMIAPDSGASNSRWWSWGADGSTLGSFTWTTRTSDGVSGSDLMVLSNTGILSVVNDIKWSNNTGFGLLGNDGVRFLSYTTAGGAIIGSGSAGVTSPVVHSLPWKPRSITYSGGDTTPSVLNASYILVTNGGATTITDFDDGVEGQVIVVRFADGNTTINRTHALLSGGANYTGTTNAAITLMRISTNWVELSRSGAIS